MRVLVYLAVLCSLAHTALGQKIPWSPSLQRPYTAPTSFIGFDASVGYISYNASLPYLESIYDLPCCTYENGSGTALSMGLQYQAWMLPTTALTIAVGLRREVASFSTDPISLPRKGLRDVQTQYQLRSQSSWLVFGVGATSRIGSSPFRIGLAINGDVLMGNEMQHKDVVVGPDDYFFVTDPPSKEYALPTSTLSDLAWLVLRPVASVSYDIPLSFGYYLAPTVRFETNLMSLSTQYRWGAMGVSFGVTLNKGL